jgi:SRSO17 transposase
MDARDLRPLRRELDQFLDRYQPLFGRAENGTHARQFLEGLLAGGQRRNIENLAEVVEGGVVRTLQKFISQGVWHAGIVQHELRQHAAEALGDSEGILNVDETGFAKKGKKSVGVKRQYSGTLGRVDNCQVAVMMNYCSVKGHTLIDRRLFLPQEWIDDALRREEAGVPQGVVFRTKPELALEMVQEALHAGVPCQFIGGDSLYGDSPTFVQGLRLLQKWYVLDVSSVAHVWRKRPRFKRTGRTGSKLKPLTKPISVAEAANQIPASAWKRITVAEGSQGPLVYDYAELTVWFSEEGDPTPSPERLLVRRSVGQNPELKFHRSNAPEEVALPRLAQVRSSRWSIEDDIKAAKGECGLHEYETRGWTGWHHHTILSLLALLYLVLQSQRLGKKRSGDHGPRSSASDSSSTGPSPHDRRGDSAPVGMETPPQPSRQSQSRKTPPRRTTKAK